MESALGFRSALDHMKMVVKEYKGGDELAGCVRD